MMDNKFTTPKYADGVSAILRRSGLPIDKVFKITDGSSPVTMLETSIPPKPDIRIDNSKTYYVETYLPINSDYKFYVLAHEAAHVFYKHLTDNFDKPLFLREYESETWAFEIMKEFNIPISSKINKHARKNVFTCMSTFDRNNNKDIVKWCLGLN